MGEGNGSPLQYSCLENPMDRGAWQAAVHGIAKSGTRLSDFTITFHFQDCSKIAFTPILLGVQEKVNSGRRDINVEREGINKCISTLLACLLLLFSPLVLSNSLQPHELQHTRLPCPLLSPRVCSNSYS